MRWAAQPTDQAKNDHGYAMTSHSSQGQTADRGGMIRMDIELSAKNVLNSRMAYVSVSRARHDAHLFTNAAKRSTQLSETTPRAQFC